MMRSAFFRFSSELRWRWPFVTIVVLGLGLLLTNLGTDYLWADEGDTAVLASSILKFGVPKAWDGVTFTDSDLGARENQQLTMVSTPWVQYYVAAASFLSFGENTFAARFPFALASLFTVLVGFRLIQRLTGDWRAAFCGALLLLFSVQFLLYAREARYYALSMLFSCLAVSIFFKMKSVRDAILFAVVSILLFHTHPLMGALLVTLAVLTLTYRPFLSQRSWFWLACIPISLLAAPWFFYARGGYTLANTPVSGISEYSARILQYLLEVASVTQVVGCLLLFIALVILSRRGRSRPKGATESGSAQATDATRTPQFAALTTQEAAFLVLVVATIICSSLAISLTQDVPSLRIIGLRYTAGLIPLVALAAGMLIAKVSRRRALV